MGSTQSAIVNWNVSLCAAVDLFPNKSQFEWYALECPDMPGYFSEKFRIIATTIQSLIFFVGLFGNLMVILVVKRTRSMHTPTNCYLVSLSMADMLLLVTAVPEAIWSYYQLGMRWDLGTYTCSLAVFLQYLAVNVSALSIFAFTVERYVAVCHPLHAQKICTIQRALRIIVGIWIFGIIYCLPWLYLATTFPLIYRGIEPLEQCRHRLQRDQYIVYYFFDLILFYIIPLILIIIMYARIAIYLVHSGEQLRATRGGQCAAPPVTSSSSSGMMMRPLRRSQRDSNRAVAGSHSGGRSKFSLPKRGIKLQVLSPVTSGAAPATAAAADVSSTDATCNSWPRNSTSSGGNTSSVAYQTYPYDYQQQQNLSSYPATGKNSAGIPSIAKIDGGDDEFYNRSSSGDTDFQSNDDSSCRNGSITTTRIRIKKAKSLTSEQNYCNGSPPVPKHVEKVSPGEEDRRGSYQQYANGYRGEPKLSTTSTQKSASAFQARVRVIQMLVIVTVMFAVLWLPYRALMVYNSLAPMFGRSKLDDLWVLLFAKTLIYMNSSINPILYNALSLKFRRAFRCLLTCQTAERANIEARHRHRLAMSQQQAENRHRSKNYTRRKQLYRMPPQQLNALRQQEQNNIISTPEATETEQSSPYVRLSTTSTSASQQNAALLCVPLNSGKLTKHQRRLLQQQSSTEKMVTSAAALVVDPHNNEGFAESVCGVKISPYSSQSVPNLESHITSASAAEGTMRRSTWLSGKSASYGKRPDLLQSVAE